MFICVFGVQESKVSVYMPVCVCVSTRAQFLSSSHHRFLLLVHRIFVYCVCTTSLKCYISYIIFEFSIHLELIAYT